MKKVVVCINRRANTNQPSCGMRGGVKLADHLEAEITKRGLPIVLERFHCLGRCEDGPNLRLAPGGNFHSGASLGDADQLLQEIGRFASAMP